MKIGVIGSINMDITVQAERIPFKGETLAGRNLQYIPGGKGANQAVSMAKLGAEVTMFGCVGNDDIGKNVLKNLKEQNVCTDYIKIVDEETTGIALITIGEDDNTIVVVAGANNCIDREYVDSVKDGLLSCDIVLMQHEIPQETNEYVIDTCYEQNIKLVLNPGPARKIKMEYVDKITYLTPNEHEVKYIFGEEKSIDTLLQKYPEKLIVTLGEKGVTCGMSDGRILNIPARKTNVVDTTGAGDTLNGAFTVKIADGEMLENALIFANRAASLSTEKLGAQTGMPNMEMVMALYRE